jgi:hypothetical protein
MCQIPLCQGSCHLQPGLAPNIFHLGAQEVDMPYSQMFKHKMIQKMIGPDSLLAKSLSV